MRTREVGLALKLALLAAMALFVAALAGGWATGWITRPAFVCEAGAGLCTPAATIQPTYTPYPTPTPVPPTLTPTSSPTPASTPMPTSTLTPSPYSELLAGCTLNPAEDEDTLPDFNFAVAQTSPVEITRAVRALNPVEGLATTFVLTNTGQCRLIQVQILDLNDGVRVVQDSPMLFINAGQSLELKYAWPLLADGPHTITLTLQFRKLDGSPYNLPGREFVLALNLTLELDRDGDGVPDKSDGCPDVPQGATGKDGCPDSDGDGVLDQDDCCPKASGLPALSGCPDGDGDGFPERNEKGCPHLPVVDQDPEHCGRDNGKPVCHIEYQKCTREVCEINPVTGAIVCHLEEYDCDPYQVCEPCP